MLISDTNSEDGVWSDIAIVEVSDLRAFMPKEAQGADICPQQSVVSTIDAPPSDFEVHIRTVQTQLIDSVRRAGLTRDPYSRIVEAQVAAIGVFPEFVQTLKENRSPFTEEERREFEHALAGGAATAVNRMTWWLIVRNLALAVGALTVALALGTGVGYWLGYSIGADQTVQIQNGLDRALKGREAAQWLDLMRLNRDGALRNCTPVTQSGNGVACAFTLWTKLPSPKTGS